MHNRSVVEDMEPWGYHTLARSHPDSPGHSGLLVAIRQVPTGRHFDPQRLHLCLRDEHGIGRWRTFSWLTPFEESGHVCPGLVTIRDRIDKGVDFYTFGGSLETTPGPAERIYSFRSPAPVLALSEHDEGIPDLLASETGAVVARGRVAWGPDEAGFNRRLATADPLVFYVAALKSILTQCEGHGRCEETVHELHLALLVEKEWLTQHHQWPSSPSGLLELLAAPGEETP